MIPSRMSLQELQDAVKLYHQYFDQLESCFVGREDLLRLLKWAMIQRQHILAFGKPGTAKTAVCDRAFEGIENAEKFRIELAMSMLDDAIFGPYNVKKLREEGILEHNIDGMLPRADLARLGPDSAPDGLLRYQQRPRGVSGQECPRLGSA